MQAPGGKEEDTSNGFKFGGWTPPYSDPTSGKLMLEQMAMPFDLLLGRKTYQHFAGYWPRQGNDNPIAKAFNAATKYVVSDSSPELTWDNSELITGDVVAKIKELKAGDGPMLQVQGSSTLVQTLLKEDLVDELWLKTFPVTLGNGLRLWGDGVIPLGWELTRSEVTPKGIIFAWYKRAGEVKTGSFE